MSLSADTIALLIEKGLTGADLVQVLRAIEADLTPKRNGGAERQARYRARLYGDDGSHVPAAIEKLSDAQSDVTSDGDSDVTVMRHSVQNPPPRDINSTPPELPSVVSISARRAAFDRFRQAYPRRKGSNPWQPAEEKFCRLAKSGVDPEVIIRGAAAYAQSRIGEDPRFTKQAIAFLNQGMWKDDHEPSSVQDSLDRPPARAGPPRPHDEIRDPMVAAAARYAERH